MDNKFKIVIIAIIIVVIIAIVVNKNNKKNDNVVNTNEITSDSELDRGDSDIIDDLNLNENRIEPEGIKLPSFEEEIKNQNITVGIPVVSTEE